MAVDLNRLESRVRHAYERGRLRHALAVSAPVLLLGALVLLVDRRPLVIGGLAGLLFATEALFVWRGQQLGRGALAGLAGGAIPLVFGLCMQVYARVCGGMLATPICTTVCTAGGLLAGLWIARIAHRQPSRLAFAGAAAATAVLMGAIGCSCAGLAGVVGLLAGIAVPIVAERVEAATRQAAQNAR
jgi:hypothetical protein